MYTKYTDTSTAVTVGPGLWCMSYSNGVWGRKKNSLKATQLSPPTSYAFQKKAKHT